MILVICENASGCEYKGCEHGKPHKSIKIDDIDFVGQCTDYSDCTVAKCDVKCVPVK